MQSKVILVDQYGNLLELDDPSALTTPVVGHSGTNPEWIEAPAGAHTHTEYVGAILISDSPSTPLVFADLVQNEAQDDLVYAD